MRRNRLRERLRAGRPSPGTHVHSAWPSVVGVVGPPGRVDDVEFVGEYAPYDLFALENLARAVDTFDHMTAMFQVEQQPGTPLRVRARRGRGARSAPTHSPRGMGAGAGAACGRRRGRPAASTASACAATSATWSTWARPR